MSCLYALLSVCRRPECGTLVEKENIKVVKNGAMVRIGTLCNNSHTESWDSSPSVGSGTGAIPVINILLSVYTLLTGLHVKQVCQQMLRSDKNKQFAAQVTDYFAHLNIFCYGTSFYYNLQNTVLLKIVWMTWLFSQASITYIFIILKRI